MKLIKQLSFLLIVFIFFTRASLAQVTVSANNQTVTNTSPITDAVFGILSNDIIDDEVNNGFTGLIIDNSSTISITGVGTTNPYGIGIFSEFFPSSTTSITNSGKITSTTTGSGNSYGIFNHGEKGSIIGTITNSGTIEGVSTGSGTARGINNTSGTINSIINTGNILARAIESSGSSNPLYGTFNGTALYNHGDLAGTNINTKFFSDFIWG